eukprot:m.386426 g.386426  ORF g.386426 m.386426 type:complete len:86 (+) comp56301_c0_seq5:158-415(+)
MSMKEALAPWSPSQALVEDDELALNVYISRSVSRLRPSALDALESDGRGVRSAHESADLAITSAAELGWLKSLVTLFNNMFKFGT